MSKVKQKKQSTKQNKNKSKTITKAKTSKEKERVTKHVNIPSPRFLAESTPYRFTSSFLEHNGKFSTIVRLNVRPGSNRRMTFADVIDFIPTSPMQGVQIFMIAKDTLISDDAKKKIVRKNTKLNKSTIAQSQEDDKKSNVDDASITNIRTSELIDYDAYEMLLDSEDSIVVYQWMLLITADEPDIIDLQIDDLNTLLKQNHEGAYWSSLPGEQLDRFTSLFDKVPENRFEMTSTGSNYAGLNLNVSSGLKDDKGLPIGVDVLSLVSSTAFFDFETYTESQAIIAARKGSVVTRYQREDSNQHPSATSIAAQFAANHIVMAGHRAHHIVLNDFDYFESGMYYRPKETAKIFTNYDVSKVTLNPMQGFGDIDKVVEVYDRLVNKIVNIFNIQLDLQLNKEEKSNILQAINAFYTKQGYWNTNADRSPHLTQIVNINKPETYATMGTLLNSFTTLASAAIMSGGREAKADRLETLESSLMQALTTYTSVLGRPTSITHTDAPQVYYSFNNIESTKLKQIQYINLIEYVLYTAAPGDVVVIHGLDTILKEVSEMTLDAVNAAIKKGVRFIYAFDAIESATIKLGKLTDMFTMQGLFYSDLDADIDWSFTGQIMPAELEKFKAALNTNLGYAIERRVQSKTKDQFLIHRNNGSVNNFVLLDTLI
jgi:hypothetical protein